MYYALAISIVFIFAVLFLWVGIRVGKRSIKKSLIDSQIGTINIDYSDPDGPYMFLSLAVPVTELKPDEYRFVYIKHTQLLSQNEQVL